MDSEFFYPRDDARTPEREVQARPAASNCQRTARLQESPASDERTAYELPDRRYHLNQREARMLTDIGKFRATDKTDLLEHVYHADGEAFDRDLRHLHRQDLIRIVGPKASVTKYIVLTKPAKQLAEIYLRANPQQEIYSGLTKIRELKHDATLYRLYAKVAKEMVDRGTRPVRVVLDYELKRNINRQIVKTKALERQRREQRIREIAQEHNLRVVSGKIPLPDLRIEYEGPDGETGVRDLEYLTEHYRGPALAEKSSAGFTLYSSQKRSRKPYGPDLIGEIIAL